MRMASQAGMLHSGHARHLCLSLNQVSSRLAKWGVLMSCSVGPTALCSTSGSHGTRGLQSSCHHDSGPAAEAMFIVPVAGPLTCMSLTRASSSTHARVPRCWSTCRGVQNLVYTCHLLSHHLHAESSCHVPIQQ